MLTDAPVFSTETVAALLAKFPAPKECVFAEFAPPVRPAQIFVNALHITDVIPANALHHAAARAALKFGATDFQAVRNAVADAVERWQKAVRGLVA